MYFLLIALLVVLFILAFICGPRQASWGNSVYWYAGIITGLLAFILPFFHGQWTLLKQAGVGLLFLLAVAIVWVAGFMLGGFKIINRLF